MHLVLLSLLTKVATRHSELYSDLRFQGPVPRLRTLSAADQPLAQSSVGNHRSQTRRSEPHKAQSPLTRSQETSCHWRLGGRSTRLSAQWSQAWLQTFRLRLRCPSSCGRSAECSRFNPLHGWPLAGRDGRGRSVYSARAYLCGDTGSAPPGSWAWQPASGLQPMRKRRTASSGRTVPHCRSRLRTPGGWSGAFGQRR